MVDPPNLNNRDLALSPDNINSNTGKMASLLAKLCEKPVPDERPQGLKRPSTSAVSDNSDSESEENSHKRRRLTRLWDDKISLHASDDLKTQMTLQCSSSVQRPPAKKSGKPPPKRQSSFKSLLTALTRMTPPNPARAD